MRVVSQGLAVTELRQVAAIAEKWANRIEHGVPGEDYPLEGQDTSDDPRSPEEFYEKLRGELLIAAGKCEALATVMQGA